MKSRHFAIISFVLLLIIVTAGCSQFRRSQTPTVSVPPNTPTVESQIGRVNETAKTVGDTAVDIGVRAEKIDNHNTQIEIKTPAESRAQVQNEINGIRQETQGLRQNQANLLAAEEKLKDTEKQLVEQQQQIINYTAYAKDSQVKIVSLEEKIKELETSNAKLLKTMMSWIAVACVVGIGASLAIGFFMKTKVAFMVAGAFVLTLGISVAVSLYMQYIAWVALAVLGLACIGVIVYVALEFNDNEKAVNELVHTGEVVKTYLPKKTREKIFGNTVEPGVAHVIQSKATKKLVKRARVQAVQNKTFGLAPVS